MTVSPGDVIRVAAKQFGPEEQQIINVFFYRYDGTTPAPDGSVMESVSLRLDTMYNDADFMFPATQQADEIDFYNQTQAKPMGSVPWPTYTGGTSAAEYLPTGTAALLSGDTGLKRVLPKKFLSVLTEPGVMNNEWVSTVMTALLAFAAQWLLPITVPILGQMIPGTWRRVLGLFAPLISVTAKALVSYQRRRKPGIGS